MRKARSILLALLLHAAAAGAEPLDLHAYWDSRCRACHGDAGPFARSTLRVEGSRLLGWHHGAQLERFLRQHYLGDDLVAPVMAMLAAQVTTPPLYRQRCAGCHDSAASFARASLLLRDGVLVGRVSGRAVHDVLQGHGGLSTADRTVMEKTLARVLGEVSVR